MANNNSRKLSPSLMHPSDVYTNLRNQYNPMGNFQPTTTNYPNKTFGDYTKAFTTPYPTLNRQDYRNQSNTMHNNLADNLINEHITEYRINIDSYDRDASAYKNPFNFTVTFAPPSRQSINEKVLIDPLNPSKGHTLKSTYVNGAPEPSINREFKNVKFIKIESIVIPKFNRIIKDGTDYLVDGGNSIDEDRFVLLDVPELRSINTYGTNTHLENNFIIYPDRAYNTHFTGLSYYASRTYDDNALNNVTRLTFKLKNSKGEQLSLGMFDTTGAPINEEIGTDKANSALANNVYNKLFQMNISLVFGCVENNLNTMTKYD